MHNGSNHSGLFHRQTGLAQQHTVANPNDEMEAAANDSFLQGTTSCETDRYQVSWQYNLAKLE